MRELSIFIDESGDFGPYSAHSPYYVIAMVFHDQNSDITEDIRTLERRLEELGMHDHCVHTGPIIRNEKPYDRCGRQTRQSVFRKFSLFLNKVDIGYHCFYIRKKAGGDVIQSSIEITKHLSSFIRDHFTFFESFNTVKIYYDNGQIELTRLLVSIFNSMLANVEFKKVMPKDYKLFQAADYICTLTLVELRLNDQGLTKSEDTFFGGERRFKKNYLNSMKKKQFSNWRPRC